MKHLYNDIFRSEEDKALTVSDCFGYNEIKLRVNVAACKTEGIAVTMETILTQRLMDPTLRTEQITTNPFDNTLNQTLTHAQRELSGLVGATYWVAQKDGAFSILNETLGSTSKFQTRFHLPGMVSTILHTHSTVELAYVVKGILRQRICDKDELFYAGEICLIDKDSQHFDYLTPDGSIVIFLSIANAFFEQPLFQSRSHTNANIETFLHELLLKRKQQYKYIRFVPKEGSKQELPQVLMNILHEIWEMRAGSERIVLGYVERLLSLLPVEYHFSLSKDEQAHVRKLLFSEVKDYIETHYATVTIATLQKQFHYNPDYFNRLFKQYTGMTYTQYLQGVRLEKALVLIKTTALPNNTIARQVGYNNLGFFYKLFTARYGKKPHSFRA